MAIFSGKIIEAYYTDEKNSTVEVIYQDGKKAISHYMPVDTSQTDFKDLIKEYPASRITESTVARNKEVLNQINRVVEGRIGAKKTEGIDPVESVSDFVIGYTPKRHADKLFDLKIKMFEMPVVKENTDAGAKDKIRLASTPIDVLVAYQDLVKSSK